MNEQRNVLILIFSIFCIAVILFGFSYLNYHLTCSGSWGEKCPKIHPLNFGNYFKFNFIDYPFHTTILLLLIIDVLFFVLSNIKFTQSYIFNITNMIINKWTNATQFASDWMYQILLIGIIITVLSIGWIVPIFKGGDEAKNVLNDNFFFVSFSIASCVALILLLLQFTDPQIIGEGWGGFVKLIGKLQKLVRPTIILAVCALIFFAILYIYTNVDFGNNIINILLICGILYSMDFLFTGGNTLKNIKNGLAYAKETASGKYSEMKQSYNEDAGKTPTSVYIILIIEIIYIFVYIIGPSFFKSYGRQTKDPLLKDHKIDGMEKNLSDLKEELERIMGENYVGKIVNTILNMEKYKMVGLPWEEIERVCALNRELTYEDEYWKSIIKKITEILIEDGFKNNKDISGAELILSQINPARKMSLDEAIEYIRIKGPRKHKIKLLIEQLELEIKKAKETSINYNLIRLVDNPIYLDTKAILKIPDSAIAQQKANYNYALAFWIFIHGTFQAQAREDTASVNIFNFDNRPQIKYNSEIHALVIDISGENIFNSSNVSKDISNNENILPLQKWNYIVINNDSGTMDVFINKILVASKKHIIPDFNQAQELKIGEKNGQSGGICNVVYYPEVLSKSKIDSNYDYVKMLKLNPPIY